MDKNLPEPFTTTAQDTFIDKKCIFTVRLRSSSYRPLYTGVGGILRPKEEPTITEIEQIDNGVLVRFNDGTGTIFPAFFLHACVDLADVLNEESIEAGESRQNDDDSK